jgi:MoxR-like ATPase
LNRNDIETVVKNTPGHIFLYGPPGTGKTSIGCKVASDPESYYNKLLGVESRNLYVMTLNRDMMSQELTGHLMIDKTYHQGVLVKAWKEGAVLVLNEAPEAPGSIETLLNNAMDDGEAAKMTLTNGETITPKEGFQIVATSNGHPDDMPDSLRDRFTSHLYVDAPCEGALARLDESVRKVCENIYESCNDGVTIQASYREFLAYTMLKPLVSQELAIEAAFTKERASQMTEVIEIGAREVEAVAADTESAAAVVS